MTKKWHSRTRTDLVIEVWEKLDCESVGKAEIEQIVEELEATFGAGGIESPAAIARMLADEGAVLRHPEVLNLDTEWRRREIEKYPALSFASLAEAAESINRLEAWRRELLDQDSRENRPRDLALLYKQEAQLNSRSKVLDQQQRELAKEVGQWLTIWLQEPEIFDEWLGLRLRSAEFRERFPS